MTVENVSIFHYIVDRRGTDAMTRPVTLNVRVGGALGEFVAANVGPNGAYDNVSEYIRDLIRRNKREVEAQAFERLKAELGRAFATPETDYERVSAKDVIKRNRARRARA
jgi:Arc/MetJ-type ribon-helix-helix transcriptional regulator